MAEVQGVIHSLYTMAPLRPVVIGYKEPTEIIARAECHMFARERLSVCACSIEEIAWSLHLHLLWFKHRRHKVQRGRRTNAKYESTCLNGGGLNLARDEHAHVRGRSKCQLLSIYSKWESDCLYWRFIKNGTEGKSVRVSFRQSVGSNSKKLLKDVQRMNPYQDVHGKYLCFPPCLTRQSAELVLTSQRGRTGRCSLDKGLQPFTGKNIIKTHDNQSQQGFPFYLLHMVLLNSCTV